MCTLFLGENRHLKILTVYVGLILEIIVVIYIYYKISKYKCANN